ncbi:hypothetical protein C0R09_18705 [Brevibacillus laterosporus]|uniref:hypothetical protein n=1 Tax=Brevibacillus laterosporus TaxID=1465 RepID=UPI000C77A9A8|nr:hypothetical protein [Brevibacillus laterosporus]AUM66385.1 hypothetical protein C0R09_18705 [Brevibacillus laterosporus]
MNGSLTRAHEDNSREYFYCYSPNLYEFLKRKGLRYICSGLHEKTLRKFWQYRRDDKLDGSLAEYERNKPQG